jgi:hypothetical protein
VEKVAFKLPITTESALREFVSTVWGINIPDVQICPEHTTPWRAFADAYFAKDSVSVWKSSRGFGGKSFLLAALGLTEACTLKADVNILGGSGEQSENVHAYMGEFWKKPLAPKALLAQDPTKRETRLEWAADSKHPSGRTNRIHALKASETSIRGPHPQRLREDEIDVMELSILESAMGQTMEAGSGIPTQTVLSSTHQNAFGTMATILQRAEDRGWPVYIWCLYESCANGTGWLTEKEIERKRNEVTTETWNTEYLLQEPNPFNRAIDTDSVARMFRKELGIFDGRDGQVVVVEEPAPGATYITGADWAKKSDFTVIVTWRTDVTPYRLVAFERVRRERWPVMVGKYKARVRAYPGPAAHDGTGLGDVVDDYSREDQVQDDGSLLAGVNTTPVVMRGMARSTLLTEYINAVEKGRYISPYIKSMEREHRLASVDDVFGSGHLPDTIAAAALANTQISSFAAAGVVANPADPNYYHVRDSGIAIPGRGGQPWQKERLLRNARIRALYHLS